MILPIIMLIIGIYVLIQILKNKILTKKIKMIELKA